MQREMHSAADARGVVVVLEKDLQSIPNATPRSLKF
jgi:hypothetical protein